MLSLRRLRLLREVGTRGSLAAAAAALGQDPSSVSHQLKILETEVGAGLLERVGRGVRLTEEAQILVTHTEVVLRELEAAEAEIAGVRHRVGGTVRIAAFQTALHTIVPGALTRLARNHPDLEVTTTHIRAEAGVPSLLARDFDLVLQEDYPSRPARRDEGVESKALGDDELCLITPAAARDSATRDSAASPPPLAECAHHSWAMEPADTHAGHWSRAECRRAGFEPQATVESSDNVLLVRLVSIGLASALVPRMSLRAGAVSGGIDLESVSVSPLPTPASRRISTAIRRGSARTPGSSPCAPLCTTSSSDSDAGESVDVHVRELRTSPGCDLGRYSRLRHPQAGSLQRTRRRRASHSGPARNSRLTRKLRARYCRVIPRSNICHSCHADAAVGLQRRINEVPED